MAELTPAVVGAQLVAVSFFPLAPYIAFEAAHALLVEHHAETTLLGIRPLDRNAVYLPLAGAGEAPPRRTARLSRHRRRGTTEPHLLLSGRRGSRRAARHTLFAICWLDPVVALAIAALAITEGRRAWRGESCRCTTCATGTLQ